MKKNKFMRLASVMLMLCLITTCAISGTFAKYTTSDSATDSARVAKWGVAVEVLADGGLANQEKIFSVSYGDNNLGSEQNVTVKGEQSADVVAPGTEGNLATVTISGTPEVKTNVKASVNLDLGANWTDAEGKVYCPIVFTVNNTEYKIGVNNITTTEGLEKALEDAIIDALLGAGTYTADNGVTTANKDYAVKNNFGLASETDLVVNWAWAFTGNDVKDTYLGDQAALGNAPEISFTLSITVDQVD